MRSGLWCAVLWPSLRGPSVYSGAPELGHTHRRARACGFAKVIIDTTVQPKAASFPTGEADGSRAVSVVRRAARREAAHVL